MKLSEFLIKEKKAISFSEIRRLAIGGWLRVNEKHVVDINMELNDQDKIVIQKPKE